VLKEQLTKFAFMQKLNTQRNKQKQNQQTNKKRKKKEFV
jgi:hypothetical protein